MIKLIHWKISLKTWPLRTKNLNKLYYKWKNLHQKTYKNWKNKKNKNYLYLNQNLLPLINSQLWLINFYWIQNAPQIKKRKSSCLNCWEISNWSPRFFTAGLFMGGWLKTSTHDVTASTPRSLCSKSKTQGNASAATPTLSGHLMMMVSMLVIVVRCCSTCLAKGTSQTKEQAKRYTVTAILGLVLMEVVSAS